MFTECRIIDTTLREGEQTPGLRLKIEEKQIIIDHLVRVGITEAEIGIASRFNRCAGPLADYCRNRYPQLQLSLWCRCNEDDIRSAVSIGPDILSLSIPSSEILLQAKMNRNGSWARQRLAESILLARSLGLEVAVGLEDATRADERLLFDLVAISANLGAVRVRLADTVGIGSPAKISRLFTKLGKLVDIPVGIHSHNDFGMATANGIAAIEAGGRFVDTVVLGLGERTGCARLEEIVGYLSLVENRADLRPEELKPLAAFVAGIAGKAIADNHPVIGSKIFTCETGLHLQGLQRDPRCYEPYAPERVGATRTLLFGEKCGRRALAAEMERLGMPSQGDCIDSEALMAVRDKAQQLGRPLTETELLATLSRP